MEMLLDQLSSRFGDKLLSAQIINDLPTLDLTPENLIELCLALRDEEQFAFTQLSDLCGVDYLSYGQVEWETQDTTSTGFSRGVGKMDFAGSSDFISRFSVVYHLISVQHNRRLRLRCFINNDPPRLSSVVSIWAAANWHEREAFDLFGIMFEGHPDLRRILTDYGFIGHPFRKDFPLEGNVEVRYDPEKGRVIYQPVTIKSRVLVPKVIRDDNRYEKDEPQKVENEEE